MLAAEGPLSVDNLFRLFAIGELDEEEGNFTHLEQEVSDLKDARKTLMETLRRLETESKTLFEETFHEARKNFQDIFRKLFQGGKADMFLSNMVLSSMVLTSMVLT